MGNLEKQTFVLEPEEIYYFESVDDRVYIYTKTEVYDCPLKLYEIEEKFGNGSFLRVNKSTIINLSKVRVLNPILNGKIEVELENGEKQIISRQYAPALKKEKLGFGGNKMKAKQLAAMAFYSICNSISDCTFHFKLHRGYNR